MPWYAFSFIALFSGSFYSLSKKWALNLNISRERLLLCLFSGVFFAYFLYNLKDLNSLIHRSDFHLLLLWGLLMAAFSMAGNWLDMYATKVVPNPAYSESLKSTNAILITFGSVILFGSPISFLKILGMIIISSGFLPLILSKNKIAEGNWKTPSIIALFLFTGMILTVKYLNNLGFKPQEILLVLFFYASIGYLIMNLRKSKALESPGKLIWLAILATIIFSFVSNLANFTAVKIAPNAGYAQAIFNSSIALTLIFSWWVFPEKEGGDFNRLRWLGVIAVVLGVVLIAFG